MTDVGLRRALSLAAGLALGVFLVLASWSPTAQAREPALKVAVAPVAEFRTLAYPDSLPLHVENPWWSMTAQPRNVPALVERQLEKTLASIEGLKAFRAPELGTYPPPEKVREIAAQRGLDAVVVAAVNVGYGQMENRSFSRRDYRGRVQVQIDVLSGKTARPLTPTLILEGDDDVRVDYRHRFDYDTLHDRGPGPEIRERVEWSVKEIGDELKKKLSAEWLEAALAEESREPPLQIGPRLEITKVTLEPPRPVPGQAAKMIIDYEISGLASGEVVSVTETRRLVREGRLVAGPFETVHALGNGSHTSAQDLQVPPKAEAGLYTVEAAVEAAGARANGSGSFSISGPR